MSPYSIGSLEYPDPEHDDQFDDRDEAEETARQRSIDDSTWGVFDNEAEKLVAIAYQQVLFVCD